MTDERLVAVGLDMGTGGARAVAMDFRGQVVAKGHTGLPPGATIVAGPRVEQDPDSWTAVAMSALRQLSAKLARVCRIVAIRATLFGQPRWGSGLGFHPNCYRKSFTRARG